MYIVTATLKKKKTDDGYFEVFEDVPIGKEYFIDLDSIQNKMGINLPTGKTFECKIVQTNEGWFPIELLDYSKSLH